MINSCVFRLLLPSSSSLKSRWSVAVRIDIGRLWNHRRSSSALLEHGARIRIGRTPRQRDTRFIWPQDRRPGRMHMVAENEVILLEKLVQVVRARVSAGCPLQKISIPTDTTTALPCVPDDVVGVLTFDPDPIELARRPGSWHHNEAACGRGHPARQQLSLRLQAGALR